MPDNGDKDNRHDSYDDREAPDPLIPRNIKKIPDRQTAVALKNDPEKGHKPRITAAGREKIAEQILNIAFEKGVLVREDSELAEMLAMLEIDSPIPEEAFLAVAEILSMVYKAHGQDDPFDAILNLRPETDDEKDDRKEN